MKLGVVLLAIVMLILAACSILNKPIEEPKTQTEQVKTTEVQEKVIPNPCENVKCGSHEACKNGACECLPDYKQCGDSCISVGSCCDNRDCKTREKCVSGSCVKTESCDYLQAWDEEKKACLCESKTKWCSEQNKCVPYDSCCDALDCNAEGKIYRRCIPTTFNPYTCIGLATGTHCSATTSKTRSTFNIAGESGDITVEKVTEGGLTDLRIKYKKEEYFTEQIPAKQKIYLTDLLSVMIERIDLKGGNCHSFDRAD